MVGPRTPVVSLLAVVGRIGENVARERRPLTMEEKQLTTTGLFCWNKACKEYKKISHGNMMKYGKTDKWVQRYRCKTCRKTFTETKGTMFYRCRHSEEEIIECMAMVGDRNSLAAIHRMKGIKEETIARWLEKVNSHIKQFEEYLVKEHTFSQAQLDALWTYVGHKGEKGGEWKKRSEEHTSELQ